MINIYFLTRGAIYLFCIKEQNNILASSVILKFKILQEWGMPLIETLAYVVTLSQISSTRKISAS